MRCLDSVVAVVDADNDAHSGNPPYYNSYKMENLKTNWKLSKKRKIPAANKKLAAGKLKTFWKQQDLFCFFLKKIAPSPAIIQNFAGRRGNKSVQPPKNGWTSLQKATWKLVGEIANFRRYNKKDCDIFFITVLWRWRPDLNWWMKVLQTFALPLGHVTI